VNASVRAATLDVELPRPLRVLYFLGTGATGGAYRSLRFLLDAFPQGSVEPHVVGVEGPAAEAFRGLGVPVTTLPAVSSFMNTAGGPLRGPRHLTLLRTAWHLRHGSLFRQTLARVRPHVVHVNEWFYLQAARTADQAGIPVVLHARSAQDRDVPWARRFAERFIDRHTDVLVSIDESVRRSLRDVPRSLVVYNPVPGAEDARTPEPVRGRTRVTYLTGLMSAKGIDDLVECARKLRDRSDIHFTIYGENPRPPGFYTSFAGRACSSLGLTRNVEAELGPSGRLAGLERTVRFAGQTDPEGGVFQETDVLVFPSRMNGPGRSVFEAGIHGIPSVLALKDRVEDVVEHGRTGLIVPERDPQALADAVRQLADDPELRLRLGAAARDKYRRQFEPARIAAQMLDVYRSVLVRRQRA
jgi:glycosyltransferase involved in cell wall biosynthesis